MQSFFVLDNEKRKENSHSLLEVISVTIARRNEIQIQAWEKGLNENDPPPGSFVWIPGPQLVV